MLFFIKLEGKEVKSAWEKGRGKASLVFVCGLTSSMWIGPHLYEKFRKAVDLCKKIRIPR